MTVLAQYVVMVRRSVFDGQRQREALEALQKAAGIDATTAAKGVGLSYPQYNRYLWGKTPLRTDQVATFSAVYGVTKAELSRALGLMDDEVDPAIRERFTGAARQLRASESACDYGPSVAQKSGPDAEADLLAQMAEVARQKHESQ